jgi:hypothetical protein
MGKKLKVIMFIVGLIFVSSIVGTVVALTPTDSQLVEIVQDGTVLYTIDLATAEDQDFDIEYNGSHNVVTVHNGEVYISSADCKDHTCMNTGVLKSENLPIVCLPNHLIVRFVSTD